MRFEVRTPATLLDALRGAVPGAANRTLRQMLQLGRVVVNGRVCRVGTTVLATGGVVEIGERRVHPAPDAGVEVVHEDSHLVVIHKPSGLLTVATLHERENTAYAHLKVWAKDANRRNMVFVVHRLDKFVSGLLVFARTESVKERLQSLFRKHDIRRNYWAIVEGKFDKPGGTIRSRLAQDRTGRMRSLAGGREGGKEAVTHYRVLRTFPNLSVLEITLETGRKNQIRAHLAESGHPIAGDRAYGSTIDPLGRIGLHAFRLGFVHPVTGEPMLFETGPPAEFRRYLPADR